VSCSFSNFPKISDCPFFLQMALINNSKLYFYEYNILLNLLICILKLSAYKIKHRSKVKISKLQNLILEHNCQSCVSILHFFNLKINFKRKRYLISKQVNKYPEEYKLGHLNSIKGTIVFNL
jgi:hypothetical protein